MEKTIKEKVNEMNRKKKWICGCGERFKYKVNYDRHRRECEKWYVGEYTIEVIN